MRYGSMVQVQDRLQDEVDYIESVRKDLFLNIGKEMYKNLSNTVKAQELWDEFKIDRTEYRVTAYVYSEEEFARMMDKLAFLTKDLDRDTRYDIQKLFTDGDVKKHTRSENDKVFI